MAKFWEVSSIKKNKDMCYCTIPNKYPGLHHDIKKSRKIRKAFFRMSVKKIKGTIPRKVSFCIPKAVIDSNKGQQCKVIKWNLRDSTSKDTKKSPTNTSHLQKENIYF